MSYTPPDLPFPLFEEWEPGAVIATPAAGITMGAPVDAMGERYRLIVEFDLNSKDAYDEMVDTYPAAWVEYYGEGTSVPGYSLENALKLQEALKFWLYMNEGETANVVPYNKGFISSSTEEEESENGSPVYIDDAQAAFKNTPRISPYTQRDGTYENPNATYDQEVYSLVVNGEELPVVHGNGGLLTIDSDKLTDKPQYSVMYSSGYRSMLEYEATQKLPTTPWEYGGSYHTGKNTY